MKEGVSIYWMVVMAAITLVASIMMLKTGKHNRAWLRTAATAQGQLQKTIEIHKEFQDLSAQLYTLENSVRLMFRAQASHLTRYWWEKSTNNQSTYNLSLARYAEPGNSPLEATLIATGGSW